MNGEARDVFIEDARTGFQHPFPHVAAAVPTVRPSLFSYPKFTHIFHRTLASAFDESYRRWKVQQPKSQQHTQTEPTCGGFFHCCSGLSRRPPAICHHSFSARALSHQFRHEAIETSQVRAAMTVVGLLRKCWLHD